MKKLSLLISVLYGTTLLSACSWAPTESRNWTVEPVQTVHHATDRPDGFYRLGRYYQGQNRLDQAIVAYQKALAIDPQFFEAHNGLGTVYALQGKYDRALAEFNLALTSAPSAAHIYNNIGYLNFLQGHYAEAATAFRQATALDPSNKKAWNNLGMALAKNDEPIKSNQAFAKAIEVTTPAPQAVALPAPSAVAASGGTDESTPTMLAVPKNRGVIDYSATPSAERVVSDNAGTPGASRQDAPSAAEATQAVTPQPFAVVEKPNPDALPAILVNGVPLKSAETAATTQPRTAEEMPAAVAIVPADAAAPRVATENTTARVATVGTARVEQKESPVNGAPAASSVSSPQDRHFALEVSNGNGVRHMAAKVSSLLSSRGLPKAKLSNKRPFNQAQTVIQYRRGYLFEAARLSRKLGDIQQPAMISESRHLSSRTDVKLVLGKDVSGKLASIEKANSTKMAAR